MRVTVGKRAGIVVVSVAAMLALAGSAGAAPVLSVKAIRGEAVVHRNDESVAYSVEIGNSAPILAGETLDCDAGSWSGGAPISFAYQWLRDGAPIAAATNSTYAVDAADQGHSLQCRVGAANSAATLLQASAAVVVSPSPAVTPPAPSGLSLRPLIEGSGAAKRTCKLQAGWGPGAPNAPAFSFQWLRNGTPIFGAFAAEYTPGPEDVNRVLQCVVTAANAGGAAVAISGGSVDGSVANPPTPPSQQPLLSGPSWTSSSSPVELSLTLSPGLRLGAGGGSGGWSCDAGTGTCTSTPGSLAPGGKLAPLNLRLWVNGAQAPDAVTVDFAARGGGAPSDALASDSFGLAPAVPFGLSSFTAGACTVPPGPEAAVRSCQEAEEKGALPSTGAGEHPFAASASFGLNTTLLPDGSATVAESLRDLITDLPPGFIGNPRVATPLCTVSEVRESTTSAVLCPESAAVGGVGTSLVGFPDENTPLYRVVPEKGYVAAFAFRGSNLAGELTVVIRVRVRSNGDYGVSAVAPLPPQSPAVIGLRYATLCGYGAKASIAESGKTIPWFTGCRYPGAPGSRGTPFLTNPTSCDGREPTTFATLDSFPHPGAIDGEGLPLLSDPDWKVFEAKAPAITGCNHLEFEPSFEGRPTTDVADAPSGLDFRLSLPQDGLVDREGLAEAHLKATTVVLPEGMAVNPASAAGLEACTSAQIGLNTPVGETPAHFSVLPDRCPAASKLGTVEVVTPLLDKPLPGSLFLAKQYDNPFGSLLALYIAISDPETGIVAKLAGRVTPDPVTGRLSTTFAENPQVPFSDLELHVFEGARAALRTPATCGPKTTTATFTPWSAPESGPPAERSDSFEIATAPGGGPCPTDASQLPNSPRFTAGTISPKAGAYSPFVMRLARDDGSQEIKGLSATLPPGLTGRLAGVARCTEAQIAQARARSKPGDGVLEQSSPSCPVSSEVGSVEVSAGAGPVPFRTGGKVYLAGPYRGAPVSLVVIAPAVAGPFDLGAVVIRNSLNIDPVTAQVTVKSDPIPTILEGIPLDVRSVEVSVSRGDFTLNPTSCDPMSIGASAAGLVSETALSQRFQVGECEALGFKPNLALRLHGGTERADYQRLVATVTYPQGGAYANLARAAVTLPHSMFLAQNHIRTICTRVQFAAKACPQGSIYGQVTVTTPLLDEPLSGPVYLRSSSNPLPDLVMAVRGPDSLPVEAEVVGRIDSKDGGIRNSFELVPDVPLSKVVLRMQGGAKSLIVNSRDLCTGPKQRATARFVAQNGKRRDFRPVVANDCKKKGKKGRSGGRK